MSLFVDVPDDMEVQEQIIERRLKNTDSIMEVRIIKRHRQYEAAMFIEGKYKPGPPLPRELEAPSGDYTHWMGVRPKVGITAEEAEKIFYEVNGINALYRIQMKDDWGKETV